MQKQTGRMEFKNSICSRQRWAGKNRYCKHTSKLTQSFQFPKSVLSELESTSANFIRKNQMYGWWWNFNVQAKIRRVSLWEAYVSPSSGTWKCMVNIKYLTTKYIMQEDNGQIANAYIWKATNLGQFSFSTAWKL